MKFDDSQIRIADQFVGVSWMGAIEMLWRKPVSDDEVGGAWRISE